MVSDGARVKLRSGDVDIGGSYLMGVRLMQDPAVGRSEEVYFTFVVDRPFVRRHLPDAEKSSM